MTKAEWLKELRRQFEKLMHLAGYAGFLEEAASEMELTAIALEELHEEGDDLMTVAQELRDGAAAVKASSAAVKTAIDSAVGRLSDNPTAADIQAALADLTAAGASNAESLTAAGAIDPDDTSGGVVVDPADPGEVVEAPPA